MTKVVADITMSLDGFVTGPDPDLEHGLGRGGDPLHAWVESDHEVDREVLREIAEAPGAVVMGRRLFDIVDGPHGWSDEVGYVPVTVQVLTVQGDLLVQITDQGGGRPIRSPQRPT